MNLKPIKVRHKTKGWAGIIEFRDFYSTGNSSHRLKITIKAVLTQNSHDENGTYHEDPWIDDFDDLEVISEPEPTSDPY